jgi:putative SOS response-associated peptidase YedK
MCANYIPASPDQLQQHFAVSPPDSGYKDEAYPGYMAPFIRLPRQDAQPGARSCALGMFGMVPHWADTKLVRQTYNARTETVATKPSFRNAFKRRVFCIIPADTVFEPSYESGKPVRHAIKEIDGYPLGIAGLWEYKAAGGEEALPLLSFSMLTVNADGHAVFQKMHKPDDEKRMVIILQPDQYDAWLTCPAEEAPSFFTRYPAERLYAQEAPRIKRNAVEKRLKLPHCFHGNLTHPVFA